MTYTVTCPDPQCATTFTHDADPKQLATGDGDLVTCQECGEAWEWDYDPNTDTLDLCPEEDDDETCELCGLLIDDCECDDLGEIDPDEEEDDE